MLLIGDNRETLKTLPAGSVDCVVTSPPYWGLRDYGAVDQIGLEGTPESYIDTMMSVVNELHRVLCSHGTLWLNIGDTYASKPKDRSPGQVSDSSTLNGPRQTFGGVLRQQNKIVGGLKQKDLAGIPWLLAFAIRDAGWFLRSEIIWNKPAPMPGSMKDRPTRAHETIFLFTKQPTYYYDWYAISEECVKEPGGNQDFGNRDAAARNVDNLTGNMTPGVSYGGVDRRNKRGVWTISTVSYRGAHFAVFPPELPRTCILAGCPELVCTACGKPQLRQVETDRVATRPGNETKVDAAAGDGLVSGNRDPRRHVTKYVDKGFRPDCKCGGEFRRGVVLDPFMGSGTTAQVAQELGRDWIGCELNPEYAPLIDKRTEQPMLF